MCRSRHCIDKASHAFHTIAYQLIGHLKDLGLKGAIEIFNKEKVGMKKWI